MLPMTIEFHGDVAVLKISDTGGRMSRYRPRLTVKRVLEEGAKRIILDLENLRHIDSVGVSEIISCHSLVKKQGAILEMSHVQPRVREAFDVLDVASIIRERSVAKKEEAEPDNQDQG